MKRFFTFLLNRLFWLGDLFLLFIELNIELLVRFIKLIIHLTKSFFYRVQRLYQRFQRYCRKTKRFRYSKFLSTGQKPPLSPSQKPPSFYGKIILLLCQYFISGFGIILFLFLFPLMGPLGATIADSVWNNRDKILILFCFVFLFYLPQQRIFRDPVTRFFFEQKWFQNYGEAVFLTQLISFLIMVLLLISFWLWNYK